MNRSSIAGARPWWTTTALCLLAAGLIVPIQKQAERGLDNLPPDPDILYFGSTRAVQMIALGYDSLLADIYWMRAIQYYGRQDEADRRKIRYKNLSALLETTVALDPDLIDAYRAGSSFLAEPDPIGAGRPDQALSLLDRGIASHPDDWRLYFDKGFIYYWNLRDFAGAGRSWMEGSRLKGAPMWLESLAAMGMSRGGEIEIARSLWRRQYEQSTRADVRDNARNHLASIQMDEDKWLLEFLVEKLRRSTGRFPPSLADLVRSGYLKSVPADPSGVPYVYDPSDGTVRQSPESRIRYLKMPYDYRDVYLQKLARIFGPL